MDEAESLQWLVNSPVNYWFLLSGFSSDLTALSVWHKTMVLTVDFRRETYKRPLAFYPEKGRIIYEMSKVWTGNLSTV